MLALCDAKRHERLRRVRCLTLNQTCIAYVQGKRIIQNPGNKIPIVWKRIDANCEAMIDPLQISCCYTFCKLYSQFISCCCSYANCDGDSLIILVLWNSVCTSIIGCPCTEMEFAARNVISC